MKRLYLYFLFALFCFLFVGCGNKEDNSAKNQNAAEEVVQIEQSDQGSEISDTNLPLPIQDEVQEYSTNLGFNPSVTNTLYKKKCASCHGKKGERSVNANIIIKNLDQESFIKKLSDLENDESKKHNLGISQRQIENLAKLISKGSQ